MLKSFAPKLVLRLMKGILQKFCKTRYSDLKISGNKTAKKLFLFENSTGIMLKIYDL